MSNDPADAGSPLGAPHLLLVDHDGLARSAIASYLRECGYHVVEAVSAAEAIALLRERAGAFDIAFVAVDVAGDMDGFALAHWIREHAPGVHVLLAATEEKAASLAGTLCETGPHLRKPYEPQSLVDWIRRLRAPSGSGA